MKNFVLAVVFAIALFSIANTSVLADSYAGPSYSIAIDKLVAFPTLEKGTTTYTYVDNLSSNDFTYSPGGYVFYKVKVKNTSSVNIDNVVVKDIAPQYVDVFTSQINVGTLQPQEEKEYIIQARVQQSVPGSMTCVTNTAQATSNQTGMVQDTAQLCIKQNVPVAKSIPQAGPEFGLVMTALSAAAGYTGLKLRKIS